MDNYLCHSLEVLLKSKCDQEENNVILIDEFTFKTE